MDANRNEEQEIRRCPDCGGNEHRLHLQKEGLRLVRCQSCSMIYANPAPAEFASGRYYDQTGAGYYLSPAKLESDYAAVRFERELRLFRKYCESGAVLDVGCSTGGFLFQLQRQFGNAYDLLGMDASSPALDYAESQRIAVLRGDFLTHNFGNARFEAVTFWAVLEHVVKPQPFLEKARELLRPGGLCFVLVPNADSLASRLLRGRYRYIYPQHLNYFTSATLKRLAEKHFSIVETRYAHFNPLVIWQDWRRGGAEVSNEERAELLKRTTGYKESRLLKPVQWGYRLAETGLAALGLADNLAMVLRRD